VGLSAPLFARRDELLAHALSLVQSCDCRSGCPACVGPILAADEDAACTPKALAARVLTMLRER
jgi:DEAD/DEAH box helicase domain-containing protein